MMMEEEFQDRNNVNINDIDLSLLRLSSPPYDYSRSSSSSFFFSAVSPPGEEISPLKRSSPVSDESDQHKRRKISPPQNPILITSPLRFTYPETHDDPTRFPNLTVEETHCSRESSVSEKQQAFKTHDSSEAVKMGNNHEEESDEDETNCAYEKQKEEKEEEGEECGEGMRIERSGEGYVIRLKCSCKQAFRVLFSDHHLYFKPL
ncbi:unnamed protein product [Cochlearia groenlandica]